MPSPYITVGGDGMETGDRFRTPAGMDGRRMADDDTTFAAMKQCVREFTIARDWEQFHHPKDLGLAMAIEVGEILEHFRYSTNEQIADRIQRPDERRAIAHEMADVQWLLLRLADVCQIDLSDSLREKLALAELKYPAEMVRGLPFKYTHYQSGSTTASAKESRGDDAGQ